MGERFCYLDNIASIVHFGECHQNGYLAGVHGQTVVAASIVGVFVVVLFDKVIVQKFLEGDIFTGRQGFLTMELVMLLQIF